MKIRIAVVFGGRSGEHDVSCSSATSIMSHLDAERYEILDIKIGRDGEWIVAGEPTDFSGALAAMDEMDVVFPALHGPYGEDGTIQAVLEFVGVPYVGNGVLASAAGMDKEFTKKLLVAEGLRVADGVNLREGQSEVSEQERERLGLPVFVKPSRAGSSLGVSKVDDWADLEKALALARTADSKVLIEEAVVGREIDVAVLEHPDGRIEAGPPLEIRVADGGPDFFDYDAKYTDSGTVFDIPAKLDPATTALLQERAVQVFMSLGCRGLLRVDFFLPADSDPVVNEVNTFPGFTSASQYPRMWRAVGLDYPELLDILIATARPRASSAVVEGEQLDARAIVSQRSVSAASSLSVTAPRVGG